MNRTPLISCLLVLSIPATSAIAQNVLTRVRLGNNVEDVELIRSGRYANQLAVMDGFTVVGLRLRGDADGQDDQRRKLFDVTKLPITGGPRGMAYVESEGLFVFGDVNQPDQLFFSDDRGNPRGARTIVLPPGDAVDQGESLTYLPSSSSFFPDHIVQVVWRDGFTAQAIDVLRRDGQVETEIPLDSAISDHGASGFCFLNNGTFLISTYDGLFFRTDVFGHLIDGPIDPGTAGDDLEGLAQLEDGTVLAAAYGSGKVWAFTQELDRRPARDRSVAVGIGLSIPVGVAWNPDTGRFLILSHSSFFPPIYSVPSSLNSKTIAVDLGVDGVNLGQVRPGISYLPDEHRLALPVAQPNGIALYGSSGLREDTMSFSISGRSPLVTQYVPSTRQFAILGNGGINAGHINFVDRSGAPVRSMDVSSLGFFGFSFAYFDPADRSGGKLLLLDAIGSSAAVIDLNGNLLTTFDYRSRLNLPFGAFGVTAITSGRYAGAFATLSSDNSEIVIFNLGRQDEDE